MSKAQVNDKTETTEKEDFAVLPRAEKIIAPLVLELNMWSGIPLPVRARVGRAIADVIVSRNKSDPFIGNKVYSSLVNCSATPYDYSFSYKMDGSITEIK